MFLISSPSLADVSSSPQPVFLLISVIVNAILEVFFLCLVGWILARRGIVNDQAKQILNKLNVNLFTPALLFSKVAFSLTPDKFKDLAIIPVGFVIVTVLSAGVAWCLGTVLRLKHGQRNFAMACAMFQNSNSLPIALMQSLIGENMPLAWSDDDTQDKMLGRALSYLVLFSTLGIIVRWSIGVRLLTSAEAVTERGEAEVVSDVSSTDSREGSLFDDEENNLIVLEQDHSNLAPNPILTGPTNFRRPRNSKNRSARPSSGRPRTPSTTSSSTIVPSPSSPSVPHSAPPVLTSSQPLIVLDDDEPLPASSQHPTLDVANKLLSRTSSHRPKKPQSIFHSFPSTPMPSVDRSGYNSTDDGGEERGWAARRRAAMPDEEEDTGIAAKAWKELMMAKEVFWRVSRPVRKVAKRVGAFMTVPLWAALLSLFVACIPPLQSLLNEIEPFKAAVRNAGNCSVPITLVTLGAYFYRPSSPTQPNSRASSTFCSPMPAHHPAHRHPPNLSLPSRIAMSTSFLSLHPLNFFKRGSMRLHDDDEHLAEANAARETRTVIVAVVSRMLIVPAILLPLFGWYVSYTTNVADDPVFVVVACLLIGSPTAITLAQMTSSAAGTTFEKLISRTLFVSYAIMTAPCTIILVLVALYIDSQQ